MASKKQHQTFNNPPINEYVLEVMRQEAKRNKEWAITANNEDWKGRASEISLLMLQDFLSKSIEELAFDSYKYFYMRAHAMGTDYPIDPAAVRRWEEITGENPIA